MSIADRLAATRSNPANRGCETCLWLQTLSPEDQAAFQAWYDEGKSLNQLHEICSTDPENPLKVGDTAMRAHFRKRH